MSPADDISLDDDLLRVLVDRSALAGHVLVLDDERVAAGLEVLDRELVRRERAALGRRGVALVDDSVAPDEQLPDDVRLEGGGHTGDLEVAGPDRLAVARAADLD